MESCRPARPSFTADLHSPRPHFLLAPQVPLTLCEVSLTVVVWVPPHSQPEEEDLIWTLGPFHRDSRPLNLRVPVPKLVSPDLSPLCAFTTDLWLCPQPAIESGSTLGMARFCTYRSRQARVWACFFRELIWPSRVRLLLTGPPSESPPEFSVSQLWAKFSRLIPPLPSTSCHQPPQGRGTAEFRPFIFQYPSLLPEGNDDRQRSAYSKKLVVLPGGL